ncbi:MAG: flavodoxin family protein [Spirochaetes bacterium]|nr:flavodoxin family protein [Spirochaetota bacterium]
MKILAINGSPRKKHNTAVLLNHALEGAASAGAQTEIAHLYDFEYKGCISCFACKVKNCKEPGICLYKDALRPLLEKALAADALVLGSPVYFESVTGMMRSFMERLLFPALEYTEGYKSILKRKIPTGFIYTMNVPESYMETSGYRGALAFGEADIARLLGYCEWMAANDTVQFDDYSKYVCTVFDEAHKKQVKSEQFPKDCSKAFAMGEHLVKKAREAVGS